MVCLEMKEFPEKQFQVAFGDQRTTEVLKGIKDKNKRRILMAYSNYQLLDEIEHDNM